MSASFPGLDRLPYPSCVIDHTGTIRFASAAWTTGSTARAHVGARATELIAARGADDDGGALARAVAALLDGELEHHEEEVTVRHPSGERWLALHAIAVQVAGERCVLVAEHDVTAVHLDERRRTLAGALGAAALVTTPDERLRRGVSAVVVTLGWAAAATLWHDVATDHLVGDRTGPRVPSSLPARTGLLGEAFAAGAPRWMANAHDPDLDRLRAALALPLGTEAPLYTVPVVFDGRCGLVAFFPDRATRPDDATLRLVEGALAPPLALDAGLSVADRYVARAAAGETPVLVVGEAASDRRLAARRLHELSSRRRGPLVTLDATRLDRSLELVLFGDARAHDPALRRGLVDEARAGTLVIEEVDALDDVAQVVLMRLLDRGAFRRRGATDETPLDARVVATTRATVPRLATLFAGNELAIPALEPAAAEIAPTVTTTAPSPLVPLVERERDHIQGVLTALRFNVRRASQILGISRTTLYEKIRAYDIDLKSARQTTRRPYSSRSA